ncbi:MAG: ATP synthase F1 subunit delta [Myxococcaceae bacterium]|nr:ATP synthase F1 subunit delta [Myxococcaceae bacterium]
MVNVSIARRYARALLEASGASADEVLAQLEVFVGALQSSRELADVVNNPAYTGTQRNNVVDALIKSAGNVNPSLVSALKLLTERGRLATLPDIARIYRDLVDVRMGRVRGRITSAKKLDAAAVKSMEGALEKLTQKKVVLETKEDPSLIGGATATVGSQTYDGSLRSQLDELKHRLRS